MPKHVLRDDPHIAKAIYEQNWLSFLQALERKAPDLIDGLRCNPLKAFTRLAERYSAISTYPFGSLTCEWDGKPALTMSPFGDLANLIRSPDRPVPHNPWPPSAAFWEQSLRLEVLELARVITDWGAAFQDEGRLVHYKIIDAGLETMRAWAGDPSAMAEQQWWGIGSCVPSLQIPVPHAELTVSGWDPQSETEDEFKTRIAALVADINTWAKTNIRDVRPLIKKFESKRNLEHFEWAALRIAGGLRYGEIAEIWASKGDQFLNLDESTVRKGVKSTLVSLKLRDSWANRK